MWKEKKESEKQYVTRKQSEYTTISLLSGLYIFIMHMSGLLDWFFLFILFCTTLGVVVLFRIPPTQKCRF